MSCGDRGVALKVLSPTGNNVTVRLITRLIIGSRLLTARLSLGRLLPFGARLLSLVTRRLVRAGRRARVFPLRPAVLMYHRIALEPVDPWGLAVSPMRFDEQVQWLSKHRTILPLAEFARLQREARLPARAVAITFDDGYACNVKTAAPILEAHEAPATFFVTLGPVTTGQEFWWDELQRIVLDSSVERIQLTMGPESLLIELGERSSSSTGWPPWSPASGRRQQAYMRLWHAVRALEPSAQAAALTELRAQAGIPLAPRESHRPMTLEELWALTGSDVVDLGCHTTTHPSLPIQPPSVQRAEIADGREACAKIIGQLPATFAYPFGDYDSSVVDLVRYAGFEAACTTDQRGVTRNCDVLALPRLQVMDWSANELARQLRVL
jgi:peptidoglycan/xylan/chitin deacetylase (PgdA/CDA1 family)